MTHREKHVSSPAQVPLVVSARRDGEQHNNRDTNEQDMLKSNIDQQHLGATNNSKKRKIQQARSVDQVQAINDVPEPIIDFTEQDAEGVDFPHDDTLVISVQLTHAIVDIVMVDNVSLVNLLELSVIEKMGLESAIQRKAEVLTGFNRPTSTTIGTITLDVTYPSIVSSQTFMIVNDPSPHNGILGHP
ncbi:uncharacterized protein [Malus domestica]|uniref:uncharacterized protein n=1 Tax=Malus domestica TaxID=3750 RepID=UPI003974D353